MKGSVPDSCPPVVRGTTENTGPRVGSGESAGTPGCDKLGPRQLAPTALVSRTPLDKTLAALRAEGYAPVAETTDGTVHMEQSERRRAAQVPPTDVRQLAHAINDDQAVTVEYVAASGSRTVRALSRHLSRVHGVMPAGVRWAAAAHPIAVVGHRADGFQVRRNSMASWPAYL